MDVSGAYKRRNVSTRHRVCAMDKCKASRACTLHPDCYW